MIISHRFRFIFIKTGKTAGTSIEAFLSRHCGEQDIITPVYPPVEGHTARNCEGAFNPLSEIIYAGVINPSAALFYRNIPYPISAVKNGVRQVQLSLRECKSRIRFSNHLPAYKIRARVSEKIWGDYFKFCVERNPWDKTLSHYHMLNYRSENGLSFNEYLARRTFSINYPQYTDWGGRRVIVDRVIKYENLLEELGEVLDSLSVPFDGSLGVFAKSEYRNDRRNYREIYTKEQKEIIEKAFRPEICMHGYRF